MASSSHPTPVRVAVVLLWVEAILALLLGIIALLGAANTAALTEQSALHGETADHLRTVMLVAGITLLIVAVINAAFASRIGKGSHTARMIYTVLAVLGILGSLFSAFSGQSSHLITAIIPVIILLVLWAPQSSQQFFAQSSTQS